MTTNPNIPSERGATRLDRPIVENKRVPAVDLTEDRNEETYVREEVHDKPVQVSVIDRHDQVRWGPVWAGALTTLATFLLLELAFFALGWLTLDPGVNDPNRPGLSSSVYVMTGLAGALAFLLGGLTAGATAMWKGLNSGLLHGMMVWALSITGILLLSLLGGGALFGAFSNVLGQITLIQNAVGQGNVDLAASTVGAARDAAGWAVLALGVFIGASALGGILGSKMWPRGKQSRTVDVGR